MPTRQLRVAGTGGAELRAALDALREALALPGDFPAEAGAEAERVARAPLLPDDDATSVPFFTVDRPGAPAPERALHLRRRRAGFRLYYALADPTAFVRPGGALDRETHRRARTLRLPDRRLPLHPPVLSQGAAALLPRQDRPALLWRIDLDPYGAVVDVDVRRALVRSRARFGHPAVQRALDDGTAADEVVLLREVGLLREERERERGGVSLTLPEQEIVPGGEDGEHYTLAHRPAPPAAGWDEQLRQLAGTTAAELMLRAGVGVLRTVPAAPDGAVARLRRVAHALDVEWPHHTPYDVVVRSLDPARAAHAAFLQECTALFHGAGYTVFDGDRPSRQEARHAAVAAAYAHCTEPLQRVVDRYTGELCLAAAAGREPPEWARDALAGLPATMAAGDRRHHAAERACLDTVATAVLRDRVGEVFGARVVDRREDRPHQGTVQLAAPAVAGRLEAPAGGPPLPLDEPLRVRLTEAALPHSPVLFVPA
ncbi:RNB domain-containing ribonuclease [Streptomyces sp. JJ36]|uniref:RNB domain-containing ribonuclease n=1 Tax=Streptomyces sp. JJ36 TaxID=2736645 RepID=UPI001F01C251|nr:RNB domain-containing ribonuclease [Streptomyces sp. JJ36]MCF6521827.1 RNB domain-containing ribonuclease [Streptomyces sp. JJ36]